MKLSRVLFWAHLTAAIVSGLVVLMLSITGVLLTYERQIVGWADRSYSTPGIADRPPLTVDELVVVVKQLEPTLGDIEFEFSRDADTPVKVAAGGESWLLDPHTGTVLRQGSGTAEAFFDYVTELHRWFALSGDGLDKGQAIIGFSNLMFLFVIVTGIYIWLPRVWRWSILRNKMLFNPRAAGIKALFYNWHQVFSSWFLLPLFIISITATVFYYPWANSAVYAAFGENVPTREHRGDAASPAETLIDVTVSKQDLLDIAKRTAIDKGVTDWYSVWMEFTADAQAPAKQVNFYIDRSIGGQPSKAYELMLAGDNGQILEWKAFEDNSPGQRARVFIRFLHTGEVFGFIGQTIAGLASLAALLLVVTGFTLAWKRLVSPLFTK